MSPGEPVEPGTAPKVPAWARNPEALVALEELTAYVGAEALDPGPPTPPARWDWTKPYPGFPQTHRFGGIPAPPERPPRAFSGEEPRLVRLLLSYASTLWELERSAADWEAFFGSRHPGPGYIRVMETQRNRLEREIQHTLVRQCLASGLLSPLPSPLPSP